MAGGVRELDGSEPREVALPLLVEREGPRLYALARRFCGEPQEAEDVVQETFLQAFRKWHQFEGRSSAATWLYTIAARTCRQHRRRRAGEPDRVQSLDELLPFGEPEMGVVPRGDELGGPLDEHVRAEGRRHVEQAILELDPSHRMPLVLKEIAGLSLAEVGAVLGIKEATVKTRLHRARLRLRKALESVLPRRAVPPPIYSRQVCLDLLNAKQESLDRGVDFEFPDRVVCERCAELFATLDLSGELCRDVARGALPDTVREQVLRALAAAGNGGEA